ncbi:nuclease [Silicimonas algicola]|uniref:Topoisomerase-like DNA binding C4 zinc finger protein n=1 Tax=Silicimonas algicola TaxID=1826607 RepID=A0A316G3M7_9RHOB|nr:NERD domain-containing protein [Silicimonas algicola]AZQ66820.1 nuclease [Silicimonas algicola]PWK55273.1 topoisomerase-like DNA binding C4 zinc finger protein [Silicimonas algicola]
MDAFFAILLFGLVAFGVWYVESPGFKGAVGENRVNAGLRRHLSEEYQIFADLTLPSRGGTTQIDHVVVSRFGVFVIETKNMKGWIFGSADQASWTQIIHGHKTRFQNPLRQNYKHVKAVEEVLGIDGRRVHNLVIFAGSAEPRTSMPLDVSWNVQELVGSILSRRQVLLDEGQVAAISAKLSSQNFQASKDSKRAHIQNVKQSAVSCPKCRSKLEVRVNRRSGNQFLGCSQYPKCDGTRPL